MLGPLPKGYRVVVTVCSLLAFAGLGAWMEFALPVRPVPGAGAGIGAALGIGAVLLLLHGSSTHRSGPQHARVRAHRRR